MYFEGFGRFGGGEVIKEVLQGYFSVLLSPFVENDFGGDSDFIEFLNSLWTVLTFLVTVIMIVLWVILFPLIMPIAVIFRLRRESPTQTDKEPLK